MGCPGEVAPGRTVTVQPLTRGVAHSQLRRACAAMSESQNLPKHPKRTAHSAQSTAHSAQTTAPTHNAFSNHNAFRVHPLMGVYGFRGVRDALGLCTERI